MDISLRAEMKHRPEVVILFYYYYYYICYVILGLHTHTRTHVHTNTEQCSVTYIDMQNAQSLYYVTHWQWDYSLQRVCGI